MGKRRFRVATSFATIGITSIGLLLSACGSVVYKDAATTYVVAGRAATKSLTDTATTLAAAQDRLKATRVVKDAACPVAEPRVFLRDPDPRYTGAIKGALDRLPSLQQSPDCQRFTMCERQPGAPGCANICYSAAEANCIANIETKTALSLKEMTGDQADQFAETSKPLANALNHLEYGRAVPIQNALVRAGLDALLEYLDLLEKFAAKRESGLAADAKKLSDRVTDASNKLAELTGQKLSDDDKKTQSQITGAIAALGKFAGDLQVIAQNAQDAQAIRKLVNERGANVDQVISSLREVAAGDALLGAVYSNLALLNVRQDLQSRYASARDDYERSLILSERDKYAYTDGKQLQDSVTRLFDAMSKSHEALVRLVQNPSDRDLQALNNARFQEFKLIAADVVALAKPFI